MQETDLFGEVLASSKTPRAGQPRKVGYAARPGTGPKNQRCYTCAQAMRVTHVSSGVSSWKCTAVSHLWEQPHSDIKPGAPACREWQRKQFAKLPFRDPNHESGFF